MLGVETVDSESESSRVESSSHNLISKLRPQIARDDDGIKRLACIQFQCQVRVRAHVRVRVRVRVAHMCQVQCWHAGRQLRVADNKVRSNSTALLRVAVAIGAHRGRHPLAVLNSLAGVLLLCAFSVAKKKQHTK